MGLDNNALPGSHLPPHEQEQELLLAYDRTKRNWRRFKSKLVRGVRRLIRTSYQRKGKGTSKRLPGKRCLYVGLLKRAAEKWKHFPHGVKGAGKAEAKQQVDDRPA